MDYCRRMGFVREPEIKARELPPVIQPVPRHKRRPQRLTSTEYSRERMERMYAQGLTARGTRPKLSTAKVKQFFTADGADGADL